MVVKGSPVKMCLSRKCLLASLSLAASQEQHKVPAYSLWYPSTRISTISVSLAISSPMRYGLPEKYVAYGEEKRM